MPRYGTSTTITVHVILEQAAYVWRLPFVL